MKNKEYVSIILPTYNRAKKIGKAIECILEQSYPYFELLIIDDGSTDDTEMVIKEYQDERIKYHRLSENGGQSKARNYGIELAKYEYIAFEDSDDIWHKDKLFLQMESMLNAPAEVGFVYHKIRYDMGDNYCTILPSEDIDIEKKSGDIYGQLLYDNLVGCPTILAKKECIACTGGFDTTLKALEDYDFALKMAKKYHAVFIDKVLLEAEYSITGVSGNSMNYLLASCMLVQKYKKDYLQTNTLNHRLEVILNDAKRLGIQDRIVQILEKIMSL